MDPQEQQTCEQLIIELRCNWSHYSYSEDVRRMRAAADHIEFLLSEIHVLESNARPVSLIGKERYPVTVEATGSIPVQVAKPTRRK